jgi:hypothetical protein
MPGMGSDTVITFLSMLNICFSAGYGHVMVLRNWLLAWCISKNLVMLFY